MNADVGAQVNTSADMIVTNAATVDFDTARQPKKVEITMQVVRANGEVEEPETIEGEWFW